MLKTYKIVKHNFQVPSIRERSQVTRNPASNFGGTGGAEKTTEGKNENFQDGMALFEAGDFKGAKLKFNRVSLTAANYLQATEYLQKSIAQKSKSRRDSLLSLRARIHNRLNC